MMGTAERFVGSGELRLWTERFGDPADPAVLLINGSGAQGIGWSDALIGRLVARGVQVIRFDHRDTGLSSVVDFDERPYALADMAGDCVAILDAYGLGSAHLVGASMGGMIAQWLGVHAPGRVRSLTIVGSSPMAHDRGPVWDRALAGEPADPDELPPPSAEFVAHVAADLPAGVESDVALFRIFNGAVRPFDEAGARAMLELAWKRAVAPAAAGNHYRAGLTFAPDRLASLSAITAPTTIVHGDQDPVFPLAHGEALAAAIPGARLAVVRGMGHVFESPGLPEEIAELVNLEVAQPGAGAGVLHTQGGDADGLGQGSR